MLAEDIEKAWVAHAKSTAFFPTPTFIDNALTLGAGTKIAPAIAEHSQEATFDCEARTIALLAAAFDRPLDSKVIAHFRRGLQKQAEGDNLTAAVHLALMGLPRLERGDGASRRLFVTDRLLRAGVTPETIFMALGLDPQPRAESIVKYNPDQPRVPAGNGRTSGQWMSGDDYQEEVAPSKELVPSTVSDPAQNTNDAAIGSTVASTIAIPARAGLAESGSFFATNVAPRALAVLAQLALRAAGPVALFGMLVVPSPSDRPVAEGMVPGRTDLKYEWFKDAGVVLLHRLIDGQWVVVAQGRMDLQGTFHDRLGKPFARVVNRMLVMDITATAHAEDDENDGNEDKNRDKAALGAAAIARTTADSVARAKKEPKLCPKPMEEFDDGWSANSREYQTRVTGLPPPLAVYFNKVWFDGCREEEKGRLVQATADRDQFLSSNGDWFRWYNGGWGLPDQIDRSEEAARSGGRDIDWHFQKKRVADWAQAYVKCRGYSNIRVLYDPTGTRR
jgi:hypothetical protein